MTPNAFLSRQIATIRASFANALGGTDLAFTMTSGLTSARGTSFLGQSLAKGFGIQAEKVYEASMNWHQSGASATTRRLRPELELERHTAVLFSLVLMVLLVAGTAGYAGTRRLLSPTNMTASDSRVVGDPNREADPDRLVTPAAVALGLMAVLSVVIVSNPIATQNHSRNA